MEHDGKLVDEMTGAALEGDVSKLIRLLEARHERSIIEWSQRCQALREQIEEAKQERERTLAELAHLEVPLRDLAQAYARAQEIADAKHVEHQRVQLRMNGLRARSDILREQARDLERELREQLATKIGRNSDEKF